MLGKWGRLDDPDRYARRAVVNICKTYLRRQRLVQRFAAPSPASTLDEHDRTGGDMDARLRAGLATLRVPERTVLVLRFWMDLPDREIAEIMGIKPGTVSSHVHRGLRQLREAIDDV